MAKSNLQMEARELRRKGISIRVIARKLHVSRSSISRWVRDVVLTREQLEELKQAELRGGEIGRLKSAEIRRERRRLYVENSLEIGKKSILPFTKYSFLLAGLALYWGEGSKKNGRIQFCNSDPGMIQFFILWLEKCFSIKKEELTCWVGINQIHEYRIEQVKEYWSNITSIPLSQFTGTSFKRVENKKVYENMEEHFGTFFISVNRPYRLYYKIIGMIDGLREYAKVAQW